MQILDVKPFIRWLVPYLNSIAATFDFTIVNDISKEVILLLNGPLLAIRSPYEICEVEVLDGKVHNGRILLFEKLVLSEPLYVNHEILR